MEQGYTVFGAGSVGTVLAGILADAGIEAGICGRRAVPDLVLEGEAETIRARVPVVGKPRGTILLCVHEPDVGAACSRWPGRLVATFCNGIGGEAAAARWCRVIGVVWRMTCTLIEPGRALFTRRGRIIVQRTAHPLAGDLRRAGFDVGESDHIAQDKWLKLCVNLASVPNALIRRPDHAHPGFGRLKASLLEEARRVLRAAGIRARSCDGHDASLDEEIERQRRSVPRDRPVHNSTWRSLSRRGRPKELFPKVIVDLAARHGIEARRNRAMLALLENARAPECYRLNEVLTAVDPPSGGRRYSSSSATVP